MTIVADEEKQLPQELQERLWYGYSPATQKCITPTNTEWIKS